MRMHQAIGLLSRRTAPGTCFLIERQESCRGDGRGNLHFQREYTVAIGEDVLVYGQADLASAVRQALREHAKIGK